MLGSSPRLFILIGPSLVHLCLYKGIQWSHGSRGMFWPRNERKECGVSVQYLLFTFTIIFESRDEREPLLSWLSQFAFQWFKYPPCSNLYVRFIDLKTWYELSPIAITPRVLWDWGWFCASVWQKKIVIRKYDSKK